MKVKTGHEKLVLDVRPLLDARGIKTAFTYLKKTIGLPNAFAFALSKGKAYRISNHYMELLCSRLNCTPNDLYQYTADPATTLAPNHALVPLHRRELYNEKILQSLKTMPIEELKAFYEKLNEKGEQE